MRILLWHGYLLGGTGSNVYTRALARAWSLAGHDVTVVCQERHPERYDLGGAGVVVPELPGRLLPVFVLDRYEGLEARLLGDLSTQEREAYVEANAAALRELAPADLVFANHVLLGAPVGAASGIRFRVKAHGSELEYAMRGRPDLARWGAETLAAAEVVYAGSEHIREVLEDVTGHVARVEVVPPGVDADEFRPEPREDALAALLDEARADPPNPGNREERHPDDGNAERFAGFFAGERPTVVYFGKLIENKGIQVLLEALAGLDARAVVVGFGDFRERLEVVAPPGTLFTGPLEHRHLRHLLPLCDVAVVPSIFPEAFGMVAAEAAAAGVLPVVSAHSGLAEVAAGIGEEVGPEAAALLSFPAGDAAVLHDRLAAILALPAERRRELGIAARRAVERRWSWSIVAARLLGELGSTPRVHSAAAFAGAMYLALGLVWLVLAVPDNSWLVGSWLLIVAVIGALVPGEANQVSLARAYLAAPAFVYSLDRQFGFLAVAVAVAGLSDLVDGTVARRFARPSTFGGGLDPVVDGLFMGALCVGLALGGAFPVWLALVVIARYLLPALAGGLLLALGQRPDLRHTLMGQVSTTLIAALLGGLALLRGLGRDTSVLLAVSEVALPVAALATFVNLLWANRTAIAGGPAPRG